MSIPVTIVEGTIEVVSTVDNIDYIGQVNDVVNIQTLDVVNTVTTVADVTNVSTLDVVNTVTTVTTVADVTNISTLDTVNTVAAITSVAAIVKQSAATVAITTANTGAANSVTQLSAAAADQFVIVRSHDDNNIDLPVWVGGSTVDAVNSANGYPLDAGEEIQLPIENANLLYVSSQVLNQNYSIVAV